MQFKFDHLVHFVEKPDVAMRLLKEKGIHSVEGGAHQKRSTYNNLSYFGLSYIEFISTHNKKSLMDMEHPKNSLMETIIKSGFKEGFARFIIRTDDIEKCAEFYRKAGLDVNGPVPLSRKRPDGKLLEWKLLFIGDDESGLQLPYIIQWNENDEEREDELLEEQIIVPHPSNAVFSHVTFAVNDVEHTAKKWSKLFGMKTGELYIDDDLQAKCQTLELQGGNLVLCSPIQQGVGIVSGVLVEVGEKPFQVNFTSDICDVSFKLFGGSYKITKS